MSVARPRAISLPQIPHGGDDAAPRRRSYGKLRAATLIGVHVLAAAHIAHWRLAGKTLAPLELNEVMHTLELGIITAGFAFMCLLVLSAAVFGRFFCSWACHILALQDLCGWILERLRIRAKPVRSRVLLLVAPGAMLYMFVWPQVKRLIDGRPMPVLHLRSDTAGWASFVTDDFWRNLPDVGIALLTFLICGFFIVYVLGTRSFCLYACPYGVIFGLADRIAPGRIKVDPDKCIACGVCTGVCESHVRVHEEIARHGSVVDAACLKDLDCVAACPEGALSWGWTRPSLLRSLRPARRGLPYHFTIGEDVLMAVVFLATLTIFRGLYGLFPFLASLAVGGMLAYGAVICVRLVRRENLRFNRFQLKLKGRVTRTGAAFAFGAVLVAAFVVHSGLIRYHAERGERTLDEATVAMERGDRAAAAPAALAARRHLEWCERWGLRTESGHHLRLASACWIAGDDPAAERNWREAVDRDREDYQARLFLAASLGNRGRPDLAEPLLREVTLARERSEKDAVHYARLRASAWEALAAIAAGQGDRAAATTAMDALARERAVLDRHHPDR
ncbi:MAG: 4Fe-4S binding protein [Planctomycetes bacterium]|nr:4Fe-4S binding protein [Planctomycetota bacterium]